MIPEFAQAVSDSERNAIFSIVHTTIPAIVQGVNANGTINVKPYGNISINGQAYPYAVLNNVPVCVMGTNGVEIACPVKAGDSCLLFFSEQPVDAWISNSTAVRVNERYQIQNALAICGLRKPSGSPAQIQANSSNKVVINGSVVISGNVNITGNINTSGNITASGAVHGSNI